MSLLAESLTEEWLNRSGFFTIRGIKTGVDELDLLAIRQCDNELEAIHIECQVSFRPIGYISPLPKDLAGELGVAPTSAKERTANQLRESVAGWINKKFKQQKKVQVRERLVPDASWKFLFVHGNVRNDAELQCIRDAGVETKVFFEVLDELCNEKGKWPFSGQAGTDIADMIHYYEINSRSKVI